MPKFPTLAWWQAAGPALLQLPLPQPLLPLLSLLLLLFMLLLHLPSAVATLPPSPFAVLLLQ